MLAQARPGGEDDAVTQEGDLLAEGGDAVVVVKLRRREEVRGNAWGEKCLMDDNDATAGKLEQEGVNASDNKAVLVARDPSDGRGSAVAEVEEERDVAAHAVRGAAVDCPLVACSRRNGHREPDFDAFLLAEKCGQLRNRLGNGGVRLRKLSLRAALCVPFREPLLPPCANMSAFWSRTLCHPVRAVAGQARRRRDRL